MDGRIMTDKPRFPRAIGLVVAAEICAALKPVCKKLIIAGSLRRGKPTIGDVEILYVGEFEIRQDPNDMFASINVNLADEAIASLEKSGVLERRKNVNGSEMYGPKNKLMRHVASGIPVDLFSTTTENWFVSLVIRTGSKETNLKLTTGAQKLGCSLNAYGSGLTLEDGRVMPAMSEQHVFKLCGVHYLEPHER